MLGCVSMMSQSGWRPTRRMSSLGFDGEGCGGLLRMKMFLRIALFFRTVNTGILHSSSSSALEAIELNEYS